jgi:hypothetical protein
LVSDPVLGIVEIDPGRLDGHPFPALAVFGEELLQVQALHLLMVLFQRSPGGAPAQGTYAH